MRNQCGKIVQTVLLLGCLLMCCAFNYSGGGAVSYDEIHIENGNIQFINHESGKVASHSVIDANVAIVMDETNEMLVCFYERAGEYKTYTLGKQESLSVSGNLESLSVLSHQKADAALNIRLLKGAEVQTVSAMSKGKIEIYGKADVLNMASVEQAASVFGEIGVMNISAAKEIAIEKKSIIGKQNLLNGSVRIYYMEQIA